VKSAVFLDVIPCGPKKSTGGSRSVLPRSKSEPSKKQELEIDFTFSILVN
jgi:hypothetical protein